MIGYKKRCNKDDRVRINSPSNKLHSRLLLTIAAGITSFTLQAQLPAGLEGGAGGSMSQEQRTAKSNMQVGSSGAVSFSLPLGGGQSVSYSSSGGWHAGSAPGVIGRSGKFGQPKYNDSDIFTLNGQEMACKAGDCGKDGVYHLKNESFQKIEYIDDGGNGYWKIRNKDGSFSEYGVNTNTHVNSVATPDTAPAPRQWMLSYTYNPANGQETKYYYDQEEFSNEVTLLRVTSKNIASSLNASCTDFFYWEMPPQTQSFSYRDGYLSGNKRYLREVVNKVDCSESTGYRTSRVRLHWETSPKTKQHRITQINTYGATDSDASNPYKFTYYDLNEGFTQPYDLGKPNSANNDATTEYSDQVTKAELIDMNGDGLPDRVRKNDSEDSFKIWLNEGNSFASSYQAWDQVLYADDGIREGELEGSYGTLSYTDLIDMNGDGILDRVRKNHEDGEGRSQHFNIHFGNGSGFEQDPVIWDDPDQGDGTHGFVEGYSLRSSSNTGTIVDMVDMNGDGLPDRVYMGSSTNSDMFELDYIKYNDTGDDGNEKDARDTNIFVALNTGNGFTNPMDWGDLNIQAHAKGWISTSKNLRHTEGKETITDLIDMNGDGLPDWVLSSSRGYADDDPDTRDPHGFYVWYNNGSGFEAPVMLGGKNEEISTDGKEFAVALDKYNIRSTENDRTIADLMDMNGDGLPDRVFKSNQTDTGYTLGSMLVRYGVVGNAFDADEHLLAKSDGSNIDDAALRFNDGSNSVYAFHDMNGDSLIDRVGKSPEGVFVVHLNSAYPSETMLHTVTNPNGGKTTYRYQPLDLGPVSNNSDFGNKQWVVLDKVTDDGVGNSGRSEAERTTRYKFFGAKYDRESRRHQGFAKMMTTAPTGDVTETHYLQTEGLEGRPWKVITRRNGQNGLIYGYKKYTYTSYHNDTDNYANGISQPRLYPFSSLSVDTTAYLLENEVDYLINGNTNSEIDSNGDGILDAPAGNSNNYRVKRVTHEFDNYGNEIVVTDHGFVNSADPMIEKGMDDVTTTTSFVISVNGTDAYQWLMKPNQIDIKQKNGNGAYYTERTAKKIWYVDGSFSSPGTHIVKVWSYASSATDDYIEEKFSYNTGEGENQLLASKTDGNGHITTYNYGHTTQKHLVTSVNYPSVHDNISHSTSTSYDDYLRKHIDSDFNSRNTTYTYDGFGRLSTVTNARNVMSNSYTYVDYASASSPAYTEEVRFKDSAHSGYKSRVYVDGFGQTIQEKKEISGSEYRTVNYWNYIDDNKNVKESSATFTSPNFSFSRGATPMSKRPTISPHIGSRTEFFLSDGQDDYGLGRITKTTSPSGNETYSIDRIFEVVNIDANEHVKQNFIDEVGLTIYHREYTGKFPSHQVYSSTSITTTFNKVTLTDHMGNISTSVKDWLGRKIRSNDMDRGQWFYQYDNNGNQTHVTDALGDTTVMSYDVLNRVVTKSYDDGGEIRYYYDGDYNGDGVIDLENQKGRLNHVSDLSGDTYIGYDPLGYKRWESKRINGISISQQTQYRYNSAGELTRMQIPTLSSNWIDFGYNQGGELIQVGDVVTDIEYNNRGNLDKIHFPGSYQNYDYYGYTNDHRLRRIDSKKTDNSPLYGYEYTYDNVGNILNITATKAGTGQPNLNRAYTYDEMNRVKAQTNGSYYGVGTENFQYNEIGNITVKNSISYKYPDAGDAHPHGLTRFGNRTYGYNDNGDITNYNGTTVTYNKAHQVESVGDESYLYDYTGRRVKKNKNGNSTYYYSKYHEKRDDADIVYYYALGRKIAQRNFKYGGTPRFYHSDHLSSTSAIFDSDGDEIQFSAYSTFGTTVHESGVKSTSYQYTGKEQDSTGLYYYGARYYDPAIGRFIQADSLYDPGAGIQGVNRYSYVANNPVKFNDPTGHSLAEGAKNSGEVDDAKPKKQDSPPPCTKGNCPPLNPNIDYSPGSGLTFHLYTPKTYHIIPKTKYPHPMSAYPSDAPTMYSVGTAKLSATVDSEGLHVGPDLSLDFTIYNPLEGGKFEQTTGFILGGATFTIDIDENGISWDIGVTGPATEIKLAHNESKNAIGIAVGSGFKFSGTIGDLTQLPQMLEDVSTTVNANMEYIEARKEHNLQHRNDKDWSIYRFYNLPSSGVFY
ncbi:RHS repeat-associated core domain-containing protein [Aliikangiella sp. G2MR2-5]|uniref:RHS repeat-associated core domain-containing protein n=1 Tax=Aliikangiella sp. G2MR2-5 TaxID=2788943 RepID=UPI0018A9F12C|nr:RHS repeat-associated core domain-containing protein [Aliikangiella sp. G2MR2-5]